VNRAAREEKARREAERAGKPESRKAVMRRYSKLSKRAIAVMVVLFVVASFSSMVALVTFPRRLDFYQRKRLREGGLSGLLMEVLVYSVVYALEGMGAPIAVIRIGFGLIALVCLVGIVGVYKFVVNRAPPRAVQGADVKTAPTEDTQGSGGSSIHNDH
jgi:hypothetical protein